MTEFFNQWLPYDWAWLLATVAGILLIALPVMLAVAMVIYAERKFWAAFALRKGPNVVGPWGLLQSFADGLKVFLQETIIPSASNKGLFLIAPIITFTVALMGWAVIPFNSGAVLANINVGLLYVLDVLNLVIIVNVFGQAGLPLLAVLIVLFLLAVPLTLLAFRRVEQRNRVLRARRDGQEAVLPNPWWGRLVDRLVPDQVLVNSFPRMSLITEFQELSGVHRTLIFWLPRNPSVCHWWRSVASHPTMAGC